MATTPLPEQIEVDEFLDKSGAVRLPEDYQPIRSGNSIGVLVPEPWSSILDVRDASDIPTWVDANNGWVIAKIPEVDDV
jgi:hypothetical protein